MAVLDDLKEKALDLAQSGVAKSKQLVEIAKLKASNMAEEDTIKKAYLEIGKLYYAEKGAAPEGAYAAACGRVAAAKQAIEDNNARIAELKSADETVTDISVEVIVEKEVPAESPAEEPASEDAQTSDEAPKQEW